MTASLPATVATYATSSLGSHEVAGEGTDWDRRMGRPTLHTVPRPCRLRWPRAQSSVHRSLQNCCRAFCPGPHSTLAVSRVPGEQGAVTRQMPHRSVCERSCASTACIVPPGVSLWHAALHCSRLVSHTLAYPCLTREARAVAPPQPLGPAGRTSSVSRASVMSCRKERWSGSSPPGWGGRPRSRCPWRLHCRCVVGPRLKASCPGGPYAQGCRRRPWPDQ